ncbi:hypothetical protein [Paraburkholderia sp. MM5384-R2]|uniref:hypothetical protein n=1 Tax=Paraburkholderia sp. MM5384-R2 TaxID=2723097 RepID=UPI00161C1F19|nr:hypothetical protein [Paraburkholderia sp. MM5384-R2]MBB5502182.1 hypothetical protein [Paraburkholderia sp. MM5384-R2]
MAQTRLNLGVLRSSAASPLSKLIPFPPPPIGFGVGKLDIIHGVGFIAFKLDGTLRWVIDVRRFAGTPSLSTNPTLTGGLRIELKGARFPGTELPADLVCILGKTGLFGTPMDLTFTLGGFHAQATIERWLAGQQSLESEVSVSTDICQLGAASKLAISGHARAHFFPNWILPMEGSELTTLSGLGADLVSDSFALKLLFPGEPSISIHPKSRRTLLGMTAGGNIWHLTPAPSALPIGTLTAADGLFNSLEIEAGEGATGDVARELLALSPRVDGLKLSVAGGITDLDNHPFTLQLVAPSYAIAFDPTSDHSLGDEAFLTARFSTVPSWLTLDGFALQVGDLGVGAPPGFEVETLKGDVTSFRCAPELLAVAAPLPPQAGESVATKPVSASTLRLLPFVTTAGATPGWGVIAGPEVAGRRRLSVPDFGVSVVRREDLLSLDLLFYNLAAEGGGGSPPELVVQDATQPAYLAVRFDDPQNIAEQAYLEGYSDPKNTQSGETFPPVTPTQRMAAGPSRLVFQLPAGTNSLAYALDSLLDWVKLQQSVVPVAIPDAGPHVLPLAEERAIVPPGIGRPPPPPPQIRPPTDTETAIEAPWHLFLSPNTSGAWAHSKTAATLSNRTELWHTRLAVRDQRNGQPFANENLPRKIRAIWSPDYNPTIIPGHFDPLQNPPDPNEPFRMSLDRNDRDQIVRLSSDFTIPKYQPASIDAQKLFLTTLGAWMEVFGNWEDPLPVDGHAVFSLEQWQHRAAMARDNYVRVVTAGFLLPFGNRASLVKITERKFQPNGEGRTTAFLKQTFFILVREPLRTYGGLTAEQQRAFPYQNMRITTLVTPNLDPASIKLDGTNRYSFMPQVNGSPFLFHVVGTDAEQQALQTSEFVAPLYFVERGGDYATAVTNYNGSGENTRDLAGQKVAFAPSAKIGDTTLHTSAMTFSAQPASPSSTAAAPFFPQMDGADVVVPAIQQVAGQTGATSIKLYDKYISGAFGPDGFGPGGVFIQTVDPVTKLPGQLPVKFKGDQSGGVATPNLTVSGLSRKFGAVSGSTPDNIAAGTFDTKDIFQDIGCKLFGVVDLSVLVDALGGDKTAPVLTTERSSTAITTTLTWAPKLINYSLGPIEIVFDDLNTALNISVLIVTPFGAAPQTSVDGSLKNFALTLGGVVGIKFDDLSFKAPAGKKLDVAANIHGKGLQFLGDLSFLQTLQDLIPTDGFQDPPNLDVSADGITAGYTLPIPSVSVGVFSVENISLSAALTLPFLPPNPLRFRFAFSEREHPFLVSVSLLGGGGFFGIALGPDGVEMIEASIEFGANVSIDIVVASGNVHIMAGVYLKIDPNDNASQLTGYLRAGGSLDVLGLISASIEFYLGFTYFFGPPCKIAGEATVTIEVHVLLFSASVSASLRREFSDPKASFKDLIDTQQVWDDYCDAFAA